MQHEKEKSSMDEEGGQGMPGACPSQGAGRGVCLPRMGRAPSGSVKPKAGEDAQCCAPRACIRRSGSRGCAGSRRRRSQRGFGNGARVKDLLRGAAFIQLPLRGARLALPWGCSAQRPRLPRLRRALNRQQLPGASREKRF